MRGTFGSSPSPPLREASTSIQCSTSRSRITRRSVMAAGWSVWRIGATCTNESRMFCRTHCLGDGCCSLNHSSAASTFRRAAASWRRRFAAAASLNAREISSPIGTETRIISPGPVGGTKVKMPSLFGAALPTGSTPRTIGSGCCKARLIRSRERSRSWATSGAQQATETRIPAASPFMALTMTRRDDRWSGAVRDQATMAWRAGQPNPAWPPTPGGRVRVQRVPALGVCCLARRG